MSVSLSVLKRNAKLQSWYEDIEERKSLNMSVEEWCKSRGYAKSTYYFRQRKVFLALEEQLNRKEASVEFAALPAPEEERSQNRPEEKIVLRRGELILEIPDGTSRETILAILDGMKC